MSSPSSTATLRVMTYNVRSLRDDVSALAAVVSAHDPDVLLVQEAPRFLRWRSKRAALARQCGLVVATTDRPGGLCIMTNLRVELRATSFALLPKTPKRHQRALVTATVGLRGATWRVATTHLSTDASERAAHLPALLTALESPSVRGATQAAAPLVAAPLILGGDINEDPHGAVFSELAGQWQDCFAVAGSGDGLTSPAASAARRIDAIFAEAGVTVVSCEAVDTPGVAAASDHRPVLAVLSL